MKELYWSLDSQTYEETVSHTLTLSGWYADSTGKKYDIVLYGDKDKVISIPEPERFERPDVAEALKGITGVVSPGFSVHIVNILELAEKYHELELVLLHEEKRVSIWKKETKDIHSFCMSCLIDYRIDRTQILPGKVLDIVGWVVNQRGKTEIRLKDETGRSPQCKIERVCRPDVLDNQKLGNNYPYPELGFHITINLKEIQGKKLLIGFGGAGAKKICRLDVKKIIHEERLRKFKTRFLGDPDNAQQKYEDWIRKHSLSRREAAEQRKTVFPYTPLISIVIPLYNTPLPYLNEIIRSIQKQTYSNWQLCLADGSEGEEIRNFLKKHFQKETRLVYKKLKENGGISQNTNAAVKMAAGEFIMLSDHDDIVTPDALFEIVKALNENPDLDILYTDEDKISMDGKTYFEPNFKSDYNPYLLECNNYICHIFVVRSSIMKKIGGFRSEFDGAQDYDLILRCCEETTEDKIHHIPRVLYHWRAHMNSTASNPESKRYAYEAGKKALDEHFKRIGIRAAAEITPNLGIYRIHREVEGSPFVSVIIPNKDHKDDLEKCLMSLTEKTTYENYEILVVENNSTEKETFDYYEEMKQRYPRVRLLIWEKEFNYASINNFAAEDAKGDYLLFLNNDVELITDNWLEEMLGICQRPEVGIVGAKLYFPDETIQHAGVIIGLGGVAGHVFSSFYRYDPCYMGRAIMDQNLSAVTAACMMIKRSVFDLVEGFDETFRVAFNDVDLCMKVRKQKLAVVFTPNAELYHYESKTRGLEDTSGKQIRFAGEVKRFHEKWEKELVKGDPYYNPNLSLKDSCALKED